VIFYQRRGGRDRLAEILHYNNQRYVSSIPRQGGLRAKLSTLFTFQGLFVKYYKYADEYSLLDGGTTYVETESGYVIRQITVNGDQVHASNVSYPPWGLMLTEGHVDWDDIEEVTLIKKGDFDDVWNAHLEQHVAFWEYAKSAHPPGMRVEGFIEIFYPQGVIVNVGQGVLGVADYRECKASTKPENVGAFHKVTAVVSGYDDTNQWLILDLPQVHDEYLTLVEMNRFRSFDESDRK
jgi:hypothetical protein